MYAFIGVSQGRINRITLEVTGEEESLVELRIIISFILQ